MLRPGSHKWGYIRIITGTILGGILGFYVMHRLETNYKVSIPSLSPLSFLLAPQLLHLPLQIYEKMNERLRIYEAELKRKKEERLNEFEESSKF
ncbi:hypothetical protein Fmac_030199 [Flemingia macrophylla]|uniref:Transmembrane protein n=1 Tax=Flemingia macrophylla TaxID=520843 RepID=A0ABD1LE55_9FABA